MILADMFSATYPWNMRMDAAIRNARVVDPDRTGAYALETDNQTLLIELGTVYGREGYDYQNPYVWQGRGIFNYPDPRVPYLTPHWGIGAAQTPAEIQANIQATSGLLEVG